MNEQTNDSIPPFLLPYNKMWHSSLKVNGAREGGKQKQQVRRRISDRDLEGDCSGWMDLQSHLHKGQVTVCSFQEAPYQVLEAKSFTR